jgi:hypothetical protein
MMNVWRGSRGVEAPADGGDVGAAGSDPYFSQLPHAADSASIITQHYHTRAWRLGRSPSPSKTPVASGPSSFIHAAAPAQANAPTTFLRPINTRAIASPVAWRS